MSARPKPRAHSSLAELTAQLSVFTEYCERTDPIRAAAGAGEHDLAELREQITIIATWLEAFGPLVRYR